jgi:hypothetical protein
VFDQATSTGYDGVRRQSRPCRVELFQLTFECRTFASSRQQRIRRKTCMP